MIEKFSAKGSADLWLASSIDALEISEFEDIKFEPGKNEVSGKKDGELTIRVSPESQNSAILTLDSESEKNIEIYKKSVVQALTNLINGPEENIYIRLNSPVGDFVNEEDIQYQLEPPQTDELEENENIEEEVPEPNKKETINSESFVTAKEVEQQEITPWYKTNWFSLLICVLCPPLGIYLLWKYKIFYEKDRKIFTVFFGIYTILWAWLIFIILIPGLTRGFTTEKVDENGNQTEQINAYWTQESVSNFMGQMPGLINEYDNLYINGELGSPTGNETALNIYNQVQTLCDSVINVSELSADNAALPIQQKVNETAELFKLAIQDGTNSLNSGDINAINNSVTSWNTAENSFYSINYIYDNAVQTAVDEDSTDSSEN